MSKPEIEAMLLDLRIAAAHTTLQGVALADDDDVAALHEVDELLVELQQLLREARKDG